MSFKFNWGSFPPEFNEEALAMLTKALNKGGNKPPNLVGPIIAKELDLGSKAPQLDILEISEMEEDRFRAMFRMKYEGDGYLVLKTKVQANPLRLPESELPTMPSIGVVAAAQPLVVPMLLRISGLKLHGIIVLAVSKQDGITLVFRSDPLVSVEVHSTFDSVPSVRRMLQREIEATLRTLFQDDLPVIVHDMSVNEIRRARERKERERREYIEKQQQQIRLQRERSGAGSGMWTARALRSGSDSGTASASSMPLSVSQHLMTSQLHQRLMELSRDEGLRRLSSDQHGELAMSGSGSIARKHRFSSASADTSLAQHHHRQPDIDVQSQMLGSTLSGIRMSGDPEWLEQFIDDDWERRKHAAEVEAYLRQSEEQRKLDIQRNGVILRPSDNAVAARLASLMTMGQTLSPYTRTFEHTTMRADVNPRVAGYYSSSSSYRPTPAPATRSLTEAESDSKLQTPLSPTNSIAASQPISPGGFGLHHGSQHLSIGTVTATPATPFSATTPPNGGRSPFPRHRTLRRKVHRISGLSLGKGPAT
ncbi:ERMES complex subunit [Dipsacomyces acuminosporus]|nr:ERMES complex subunit [Dipsacomyces acuminosporus]